MSRRRWIADRVAGDRASLTGGNADHLARVLRARPGQQFEIVAQGVVWIGTVLSASPEQVEFQLGHPAPIIPLPEVWIFLSIFKFDRLEWAVEKLTELGVTRILPMVSRRTEPRLAKAAEKRVERWRKLALEAAQQARRASPPEILSPASLQQAMAAASGCKIVLSEAEQTESLKSALDHCHPPISLAFGPEGGWTEDELGIFQHHGWRPVTLGQTILRAETATIAAVAITMAALE
jgi:16S rRNA (uracil1498-N3)-methyltransferase